MERVDFDELRAQQGLPAYSPATLEAEDFRPESPEEASDSDFHELYRIDHAIHRARLMAEHEDLEHQRFLRDAERTTDPEDADLLYRSAATHGRLADHRRQQVKELFSKRATVVERIKTRPPGDNP